MIVDNFNVTRDQDDFLDAMLKYRCRILFTTRSRYENQLSLEINRYDDHGNLIEEPAGYMSSSGLADDEAESYAHAYSYPDHAYTDIQLTGVQSAVDRESVQNHLCQTCLDSINDLWFTDQPPAEYAIVSFGERTVHP